PPMPVGLRHRRYFSSLTKTDEQMKRCFSILIALFFLLIFAVHRPAATTHAQSLAQPAARPAASKTVPAEKENTPEISLDCRPCHGAGKTLPYLGGAVFHQAAHEAYNHGYHAQAVQNGRKAANCLDCHAVGRDMATILPARDPASTVNRANIAKTCGSCHGNKSVMDGTGISDRPFLAYQE